MLVIASGCEQFPSYDCWQKLVEVETDNKPLEAILQKSLYKAEPGFQNIMTLQKYKYRICKLFFTVNMLSRAPYQKN